VPWFLMDITWYGVAVTGASGKVGAVIGTFLL
jgi:hypothetical protein